MGKLKCVECGLEMDLPKHCGQDMRLNKKTGKLDCWMGSSCGTESIPKHHGKPMKVI